MGRGKFETRPCKYNFHRDANAYRDSTGSEDIEPFPVSA